MAERSGLPHWSQAGTVAFITWRTCDSLPRPVLQRWHQERNVWLRGHGVDPLSQGWRAAVEQLSAELRMEFRSLVAERWELHLDECHGACVLRQSELSRLVADSLQHFDEQRYVLTDFVIMPNHVHVLASFPTADSMLSQCAGWKHFTAVHLNRLLGRRGRFWEEDQFDHLVRSSEHFNHFRSYIAENPQRARLAAGEFIHFQKNLDRRDQAP